MLLALALPLVNRWLLSPLKAEQQILAITEESEGRLPSLDAKASKLPAIVVFNDEDRGVILSAVLKEGDEAASVDIHVEQAMPLVLPVVRRQRSNEVAQLQIGQNVRLMRSLWHELDEIVIASILVLRHGVLRLAKVGHQ